MKANLATAEYAGIRAPGWRLVLASASPRRAELLTRLRLPFDVAPSDVEESHIADCAPDILAETLAKLKAQSAAGAWPGRPVLAADTVVALDGQALGKPVDIADAVSMLERLSGREHDVFTGVALVWRGDLFSAVGATRVRFRGLTRQEIEAYVATDAPLDKAGAYGIQDGGSPVESYEGSYSNVVGLPVALMADLLLQAGLIGGPVRATIASEDAR